MRALLDWFAGHVEPYVSFRFLLGLVFAAMFVHWLLTNFLRLRELARPTPEASDRERQLVRIAKNYAFVLLLHSLSWRNVRAHFGIIAQIVILMAASIALSVAVFSREGS